jgi:DNA-binding NarL/FixJ family response regulator
LEESLPFKIAIADDHALVRGGLGLLIKTLHPGTTILECNSYEKVLRTLGEGGPLDLLLIDLLMPGMQSVESIREICDGWPDVPVVVVSVREETQIIRQVLRVGAVGYIPKTSSPDVTINAIRLVLSGGIYVPPGALEIRNRTDDLLPVDYGPVAELASEPEDRDRGGPLTGRQVKVLQLIAEGKSNKEIADSLGLAAGTIKMHLSRIYKALGAKSRTDALAKYTRLQQDGA